MQHTLQHPFGLTHLVMALLAIIIGTLVVLSTKGTFGHKWLGRAYVGVIIGVNLTAFLIYELFGEFGLFHWMALFSLLTVLMGYVSPTAAICPNQTFEQQVSRTAGTRMAVHLRTQTIPVE